MFQIVLLLVAMLLSISLMYYVYKVGIAPVPSSQGVLPLLREIVANQKPQTIADLGCGTGRIVFELAKNLDYQVTGYELSAIPYYIATLRNIIFEHSRVKLKRSDLFSADLSKYDVAYVFLHAEGMRKLFNKLIKEEYSGIVIANTFAFPESESFKPVDIYNIEGIFSKRLYVYSFNTERR